MKTQKYTYLHSLVIIPLLATTMSVGGSVPVTDLNHTLIFNLPSLVSAPKELTPEEKERSIKAAKIDAYFAKYNMPLEGYGMKFVLEAENSGIDPYLVPAISVIESTGGKFSCKSVRNSFLGWGGCKIGFESIDLAIHTVSQHLGGHKDSTDQWYEGKTLTQILKRYNSVIPTYSTKVTKVMDAMSSMEVSTDKQLALNS